jgi:hypothetical protein
MLLRSPFKILIFVDEKVLIDWRDFHVLHRRRQKERRCANVIEPDLRPSGAGRRGHTGKRAYRQRLGGRPTLQSRNSLKKSTNELAGDHLRFCIRCVLLRYKRSQRGGTRRNPAMESV